MTTGEPPNPRSSELRLLIRGMNGPDDEARRDVSPPPHLSLAPPGLPAPAASGWLLCLVDARPPHRPQTPDASSDWARHLGVWLVGRRLGPTCRQRPRAVSQLRVVSCRVSWVGARAAPSPWRHGRGRKEATSASGDRIFDAAPVPGLRACESTSPMLPTCTTHNAGHHDDDGCTLVTRVHHVGMPAIKQTEKATSSTGPIPLWRASSEKCVFLCKL